MASDAPLTPDNAEKDPVDTNIETDTPKDEVKKPPLKNYFRILSFGSTVDHAFMVAALCASVSLTQFFLLQRKY